MKSNMFRKMLLAGVLTLVVLSASSTVEAGWNHWRGSCGYPAMGWNGYNYSYYAGWAGSGCCDYGVIRPAYVPVYSGCVDPCYPTCATPVYRGCFGLLGRMSYRWNTHHYGYYWGGYPLRGLGGCCSACGDAYSDCDCGGVTSDVLYGEPTVTPETTPQSPTPAVPPADGQDLPTPEKQTSLGPDSAFLAVNVPNNARVTVNGLSTRSMGESRRYVSRNLTPGFNYTYEVTASADINGRTVSQTKTVQLQAGDEIAVNFDLQSPSAVETALTLRVPADAQVYLAGSATNGKGSVRTFRTTRLENGQSWSDYVVRVVVVRDGEEMSKEETISLSAGDQKELTFSFDVDKLAAAR